MAVPATGEANFSEHGSYHHQQNEDDRPQLMKSELTSSIFGNDDSPKAQFSKSRTSPPPSPAPAPFTPTPPSLGKRRGRKPKPKAVRNDGSPANAKKKHSPSGSKTVIRDPSRACSSFQKEKAATKGLNKRVASCPSMIRAREIQSSLGTTYPSFIKLMVKSHVASCFWLGLPLPFCKSSLPNKDTALVLEDENGEKYDVKYIEHRGGLSGGWRRFALEHNLLEGDVLVFHLVESCKLKVYIARANDMKKEVNGAPSLLNLEAPTEQMTPEQKRKTVLSSAKMKKSKRERSLSATVVQKKQKRSTPSSRSMRPPRHSSRPMEHVGNDSEEVGLEIIGGSGISKSELSFQEVKTFEDFRIMVNGMCIDSELAEDARMKYYNLCLLYKEFLHDALSHGLNSKLVAGMIGQIVSISDEIKNCKLTTTREEFEAWDNSLKSFQLLGMKVGFLRDKIHLLVKLVFESQGALDIKKYLEAKKELNHNEDEIKKCEAKLMELKESSRKLNVTVDTLKQKAEWYVLKFEDEVNALW